MISIHRSLTAVLGFALAATTTLATTWQINFGNAVSLTGWNDVAAAIGQVNGSSLNDLVDSNGDSTSMDLTINARFSSVNTNGATTQTFGIPSSVSASSFYGNAVDYNGITSPNPTFTLSSLNPSLVYTFTIYASRTSAGDNRTGTYTATGLNTVSGELNAANNTSLTLMLLDVTPDASGNIVFDLKPHASNTNGNKFIYLNALSIESASLIPEPSVIGAMIGAGALLAAGMRRRRREA